MYKLSAFVHTSLKRKQTGAGFLQIFTEKLTNDFERNVALLDRLLRVEESFDLIRRPLTIDGVRVVMYYIDGFIQSASMQKLMMHFLSLKANAFEGEAMRFADWHVPAVEVDVTDSVDTLILNF